MTRNVAAIAIGLLAAGAGLAIVMLAGEPETVVPATADSVMHFDPTAGTDARIRALEAAVAEERNARMLLEEELQSLYAAIDALSEQHETRIAGPSAEERARAMRMREQRGEQAASGMIDRLVEAGFDAGRAEWILRREEELQVEQMQAFFEARQSGARPDPNDIRFNPEAALRAELGDAQYERYLEATGRPTSVAVGSVLASSPGEAAGLQPGDEIVAYGGERVFNYNDLNRRAMGSEAGQSVVDDIVRDGVPMQVVMETGPIGISNGPFFAVGRR